MSSAQKSSSDNSEIDSAKLEHTLFKLLDRAGHDPRCTVGKLRDKLEERLQMSKGRLKTKREYVKKLIMKWHYKSEEATLEKKQYTLKQLVKLAKALDVMSLLKNMDNNLKLDKKIEIVLERLRKRAPNLQFSDTPTDAEIEMAKKTQEGKIEKEKDTSTSRKRSLNDETSTIKYETRKVPKPEPGIEVKIEKVQNEISKKVKTESNDNSEEEAEF